MTRWLYVPVLLAVVSTLALDFRELGEEAIDPEKTGGRILSEKEYKVKLKIEPLNAPAVYFEETVMKFASKAMNMVAGVKPSSPCTAEGYCYRNEVFCPVEEMRRTLPVLYMSGGKLSFFMSHLENLRQLGWQVSVSNLINCDGVYRFGYEEVHFQGGKAVRYIRTGDVYVEINRMKRGDYKVFIKNPRTDVAVRAVVMSFKNHSAISVEEVRLRGSVNKELTEKLYKAVKNYKGNTLELMISFTESPDKL